jgi:hypothetical protein
MRPAFLESQGHGEFTKARTRREIQVKISPGQRQVSARATIKSKYGIRRMGSCRQFAQSEKRDGAPMLSLAGAHGDESTEMNADECSHPL